MDREKIADFIVQKLVKDESLLKGMYESSKSKIGYFYVDDLLPEKIANKIYESFPDEKAMKVRRTLREHKYIAAQMNLYNSLLEEVVYAFQDARVVSLVSKLCEIEKLYPDDELYAGGISLMGKNHFLNPHLDNSLDKSRKRWRVLNLLYYVTPDWKVSYGGNLELWPKGINEENITIHSKFNRLVVMVTHDTSWHSVSPVVHEGKRCCVSNYYFSDSPYINGQKFHATLFRGRPGQGVRDLILRFDGFCRMGLRKVVSGGVYKTGHYYKKK